MTFFASDTVLVAIIDLSKKEVSDLTLAKTQPTKTLAEYFVLGASDRPGDTKQVCYG